jgi:hypothetical protein
MNHHAANLRDHRNLHDRLIPNLHAPAVLAGRPVAGAAVAAADMVLPIYF